jgi:hypothetical protein
VTWRNIEGSKKPRFWSGRGDRCYVCTFVTFFEGICHDIANLRIKRFICKGLDDVTFALTDVTARRVWKEHEGEAAGLDAGDLCCRSWAERKEEFEQEVAEPGENAISIQQNAASPLFPLLTPVQFPLNEPRGRWLKAVEPRRAGTSPEGSAVESRALRQAQDRQETAARQEKHRGFIRAVSGFVAAACGREQ